MYSQAAESSARRWGCGECWVCRTLAAAGSMYEARPGQGLPVGTWPQQPPLPYPCSSQGGLVPLQYSQERAFGSHHLAQDLCSSAASWCNRLVVAREHVAWMTGDPAPAFGEPSRREKMAEGIQAVGDKITSLMISVVCLGRQSVSSVASLWPKKNTRRRDFV